MNDTPNPPELRPMDMGELVDRTASFWRTHFGTLFRLFLGYQLVTFAVVKSYSLLVIKWLPLYRGGRQVQEMAENDPAGVVVQGLMGALAMTAIAAVIWGVSWIVSVAGTRYAVDRLLGRPSSLEAGLRRARARLGTTLVAFLLSMLWGLGITLLCLVPGAALAGVGALAAARSPLGAGVAILIGALLMLLGFGVAILWYILRFLLTPQVLAMEEVGALAAIRRSGQLISGRIGPGLLNFVKVRATILVTAISLLLLTVTVVSGAPAFIVQLVYGHVLDPSRSDPGAVPQTLLIPAELLQVGVQAVFAPIFFLFCAFFYVDMRVRREGLDLELRLGSLAPPAGGEGR